MNSRQHTRGFTLLELMLAITILAAVTTAVYATWSAGLNGWKRSTSLTENLQRERVVMDLLAELTQSIVYYRSSDLLYDVTGIHQSQTGDSISFVTGSDTLLPASEQVASGMRRVTITMGRDERGRSFLGIANEPALKTEEDAEPRLHVLSAEVCGFGVRYRDPRNGTWTDEWEQPNAIPAAIEYTVAFGANDGRMPPTIVTRAVELPIAQFVMQSMGEALFQQNTTNTVTRQEIDLSGTGEKGAETE